MVEKLARISNPKTQDFQVVRNSLVPGLLKTLQANMGVGIPLKIFEISDVVTLDSETDTGARNERHLCTIHYNKTPGFEVIHGLLDRVIELLEVRTEDFTLKAATDDSTFFPDRCAEVIYQKKVIGTIGVLHPEVIHNFGLNLPASVLDISIEDFV